MPHLQLNRSMTDAEFLRDLAIRLDNGEDADRLEKIADYVNLAEQYVEPTQDQQRILNTHLGPTPETQTQQDERIFPSQPSWVGGRKAHEFPVLELTPEMSLPPDHVNDPLVLFTQTHNRDLVAEVRHCIEIARDNGYDMLTLHDDNFIAQDLQQCTTGFEEVEPDTLRQAVAQVRRGG